MEVCHPRETTSSDSKRASVLGLPSGSSHRQRNRMVQEDVKHLLRGIGPKMSPLGGEASGKEEGVYNRMGQSRASVPSAVY